MYISDLVKEFGSLEKAVEYAVEHLDYTEDDARFFIALELGEITGDLEGTPPGDVKQSIKNIVDKYGR